MKRILPVSVALLFVLTCAAAAQQAMPPFVSRLTARAEGASIRLTWQDPADAVSRFLVYRSDVEITTDTFTDAALVGEASPGEMTFVDYPPDTAPYFYAVSADAAGEPATVFIPFRNKTTVGTAVDAESLAEAQPVSITGIRAEVNGSEVLLSYATSSTKRDISVYRGTQPITSTAELLSAVLIDTISSSQTEFRDMPVPGLDYYYALFDTELLRAGKQRFLASENIVAAAVRLPAPDASVDVFAAAGVRSRPLPFLVLSSKLETGESLGGLRVTVDNPTLVLSDEIDAALRSVVPESADPRRPIEGPHYLAEDRPAADDESRSEISRIVAPLFEREAWSEARNALESYLLTRRPDETARRAKYYIAQAYYFEGSYRESFIEFLYSSERFYAASSAWMDNILQLLAAGK